MTFVLSANLNSAPGFMWSCWIPLPDPHDTSLSAWDRVGITASHPADRGGPRHPAAPSEVQQPYVTQCQIFDGVCQQEEHGWFQETAATFSHSHIREETFEQPL